VVKTADWVIDLGPEGGHRGGEVVAQGPPERVARTPGSYTGQFLAGSLGVEPVPFAGPPAANGSVGSRAEAKPARRAKAARTGSSRS
jgi:excinuclease ABC subunit A